MRVDHYDFSRSQLSGWSEALALAPQPLRASDTPIKAIAPIARHKPRQEVAVIEAVAA